MQNEEWIASRWTQTSSFCILHSSFFIQKSVLLTNASFLLSGDHDGTLIVPCPP